MNGYDYVLSKQSIKWMNDVPRPTSHGLLFSKAFLAELKRGDVGKAVIFAKAFLSESARASHGQVNEVDPPIILN